MPPPSTQLAIAEMWTLDELWAQFALNVEEYRPETTCGPPDTRYLDWHGWYMVIRDECKRRGLADEHARRVAEVKRQRKEKYQRLTEKGQSNEQFQEGH